MVGAPDKRAQLSSGLPRSLPEFPATVAPAKGINEPFSSFSLVWFAQRPTEASLPFCRICAAARRRLAAGAGRLRRSNHHP